MIVKKHYIETEHEFNNARTELAECSYMKNLSQWSKLFNNVTQVAGRLANVKKELDMLEYKFILYTPLMHYAFSNHDKRLR